MKKFRKTVASKIFLAAVLLMEPLVIFVMLKSRDYINMLWAVPVFIGTLSAFIAIWKLKIIIDDNQIILKFSPHPYYKTKSMKLEDIHFVVKDSFLGITIYHLTTERLVSPKRITLSGITNIDSLIEEIVKRAKNAKIDPKIKLPNLK